MDLSLHPRDLIRIVWRRKWFAIVPAALIGLGALALIAFLPTLYQSEATLLIEQQEVPESVVEPLVSDVVERRLEVLTRRTLTSNRLLEIADTFGLYADERDELTQAQIANLVRSRIETEFLFTPVTDAQGRTGRALLAFQVRFADGDPEAAQRVTNELVSAYMAGNLEGHRAVAEQATAFFGNEREVLDQRIAAIEDDLTRFKTENRELLPEEIAFKRQLLNNLEQQLRNLDGRLRSLREQQSFLQTQIALTNEFDDRGGRIGSGTPEARLQLALAELATVRARYSPGHPDVVRLQREVSSLQAVVGERSGSSALVEQEALLTAQLAALRERYTPEHPDVQRVQRELGALRSTLGADGGDGRAAAGVNRNPGYVQLRAQLNSIETEISVIEEQRTDLQNDRVALQQQLARAPEVEREYNRFVRTLENAVADRDALADKETSTKLSGSLQVTAVGEQLTLMGPPTLPGAPYSPDVKLILAIGAVLALGSGAASAGLAEMFDRSVRSGSDLTKLLDDAPMITIPIIASPADRLRKWLWRAGGATAVVASAAGVLFYVHMSVAPLDVLRFQAMNEAQAWISRTFPQFGGSVGTDQEM